MYEDDYVNKVAGQDIVTNAVEALNDINPRMANESKKSLESEEKTNAEEKAMLEELKQTQLKLPLHFIIMLITTIRQW